jgi:hypothetical protein
LLAITTLWLAVALASAPAAVAQTVPAITQQPFVCDETGVGSGTATFVSSLGHFSLQLNIASTSPVEVGCVFQNVSGLPLQDISIDYQGELDTTFGPYMAITYRLPAGKLAGRVLSFSEADIGPSPSKGLSRATFDGAGLGLPQGTTIQSLEFIAIGENDGGSLTISDVFINGAATSKLLKTLNTCEFVP